MPVTQTETAAPTRRRKAIKILTTVLAAVALLAAAVWFFTPLRGYLEAKKRFEASDFYQALADFTMLSDFLDSENRADDCRVMLAQSAIRAGNFEEAAGYYAALLNPQRALPSALTDKIRETAESRYADGDYPAAYNYYSVIGDDACADCVARVYDEALAVFDETGRLPETIALPMLEGYRDADRYAKYYRLQTSKWTDAEWEENVALCYELGDFLDTQASGFIAQRLFGRTYTYRSYYFTTDAAGDWRYNLPAYRLSGYYGLYSKFEGNEMFIGSDEKASWTNQFRFQFSDRDRTLEVYCYYSRTSYTLTLDQAEENGG